MFLWRLSEFGRRGGGAPAARAGGAMAGGGPGPAAGEAGGLSREVGQMEMVVADEPCALQAEAPIAQWGLHHPGGGMPVDDHDALAFAPPDENLVAVHRGEEDQALYPIDRYPQSVVVPQIVELAGILAFDGHHPHSLALAVGLRLVARDRLKRGQLRQRITA